MTDAPLVLDPTYCPNCFRDLVSQIHWSPEGPTIVTYLCEVCGPVIPIVYWPVEELRPLHSESAA